MKAKLYQFNDKMEIVANDNTTFQEKGDNLIAFIAKATEEYKNEFADQLEVEIVDNTKIRRRSTKDLQKAIKNKTGLEKEIFYSILFDRGQIEEHPNPDGAIYNNTLGAEDIPEAEPSSEKKSESKKVERPTYEEAQAILEAAKKNKGRKVKFFCRKFKKEMDGTIKGARLDKRINFVQYRIETEKGMFGKAVDSEDLKFQ